MMAGRKDDDDDHTTADTPWYWQDHSSLKLDSDSPLGLSDIVLKLLHTLYTLRKTYQLHSCCDQ
jgi:hypothetical protein